MRCKNCDYPLWNLTNRQCPECGAAFRPSEFEFVLNSVRFCCPQCDQAYYGTGPSGQLVPPAFTCVTCGRLTNMDEMVLRPAEGVREEQTKVDSMPWLERDKRGWIEAWLGTIGKALAAPGGMMKAVPDNAPTGDAWLFAFITAAATTLAGALPMLCFALLPMALSGPGRAGAGAGPPLVGNPMFASMIGCSGGMFVAWMAGAAIWAASAHGVLRLTGSLPAGLGRTSQAICYSSGANVAYALPCVGVLGVVWWLVSAVIAVKEAQRVSTGRAALAVLAFPLLTILLVIGGYVALFVAAFSMAGGPATISGQVSPGGGAFGWPGSEAAQVQKVLDAVLVYGATHNGSGPVHATELVLSGPLIGSDFTVSSSLTDVSDIPIADSDLGNLGTMGPRRQRDLVQAAIDSQPGDVLEHRVGDFVFTYHGANLAKPDPQLWVVLMMFDPGSNNMNQLQPLLVGLGNGQVRTLSYPNLGSELDAQNELRKQLGLPQLPWPLAVTHDTPARTSRP